MCTQEKIDFHDQNEALIKLILKSKDETKSLWRKLYWTTAKNSKEYKVGCVNIFKDYFPSEYLDLKRNA